MIVNPYKGIFPLMAVEAPPRSVHALRVAKPSKEVAENAPNGVASLLAIAASGMNNVDLGKLSEEEFLRYYGLDS